MRPLSVMILAVAFSAASCPADSARAEEPAFDPSNNVRAVVISLERESLGRKRIDERLSAQWLDAFLDRLDPKRTYFLQADAAEFRRSAGRLGEMARAGDFAFPRQVRQRYAQRVADAAADAEHGLSLRHDYSLDEEYPIRFSGYAADDAELRERWRLRIKFELLVEKAHGVALKDAEAQLRSRYSRIARQAREMTDERLCEIYLNSLAACYNPHTVYFSPALLAMYNWGIIRPYSLGLGLRESRGELVVASVNPRLSDWATTRKLVGWHLLAVRRVNGPVYDLVEPDPVELSTLIQHGPLENDTEVILELMHPTSFVRKSLTWPRFVVPVGR